MFSSIHIVSKFHGPVLPNSLAVCKLFTMFSLICDKLSTWIYTNFIVWHQNVWWKQILKNSQNYDQNVLCINWDVMLKRFILYKESVFVFVLFLIFYVVRTWDGEETCFSKSRETLSRRLITKTSSSEYGCSSLVTGKPDRRLLMEHNLTENMKETAKSFCQIWIIWTVTC